MQPREASPAASLPELVRKARTISHRTVGQPYKRPYVRCGCGHKCYGKFFGYVESYAKGDAWMSFRRHFERAHGAYPFHSNRGQSA